MKTKLILFANILIALASCKKETIQSIEPQSPAISMDQQVADLIKRADKNLYEEVYGQHPGREVIYEPQKIRGYFRIPDQEDGNVNVDDGFCIPIQERICILTVSGAQAGVNLDGDSDLQFSETDNVRLIINTAQPIVRRIKSLRTKRSSNGVINVSFN